MLVNVLAIGAGVSALAFFWLWQKSRWKSQLLQSELERQKADYSAREVFFEQSLKQVQSQFQSISFEVLEKQTNSFLKLATERFDLKSQEASHVLEKKSKDFQTLVGPIRELLTKVEGDMARVETQRSQQFGEIHQFLKSSVEASELVRKEASQLASVLRRPEVRGSWGELQLRRVVELAGLSEHCDFEEQKTITDGERILRPDLVVHLPNRRMVVVDAKAPMDAFLESINAVTEADRKVSREKHARQLKARVTELSKKSYWEQFPQSPDFVVLFLPNEAMLYSAMEIDPALIETALESRVMIATPTQLVSLLKAVAYGWQQQEIAENAYKIVDSAKEFYQRLAPWLEHFSEVGKKLDSAVQSYNQSTSSLESRVLPSARRLKELGIKDAPDLKEAPAIETLARSPRTP
ncbi:MAG: DNA recombination protein RmuC [Bdellovibrionales bacterium CG10_big_fil_rev_8_21_14_0_10_45_34]|nr:MAG: DNA recombination protein RmuC [Bdellovibrionales bacterium CG10_big_fil_rev_8_21_14_0_10_45_34]